MTGGILFLSLSLQPSLIFSISERKVLLLYLASPYKVRTQQATLWKNLEMRKKCHMSEKSLGWFVVTLACCINFTSWVLNIIIQYIFLFLQWLHLKLSLVLVFYCSTAWEHTVVVEKFLTKCSISCISWQRRHRSWDSFFTELLLIW